MATNTEMLLTDGTHLAWRPDGKWMAFTRNSEIWVHRFSDGFERTLAPGSHATWSPDDVGRWLAYEHNGDIWIYNAGSGAIQKYISGGSRLGVSSGSGGLSGGYLQYVQYWQRLLR